MMEWKKVKLGEIGSVVGGATPLTHDASNYDGNIPWITPKDLSTFSGRFISRGERMITQKGFGSCSCIMLPQGSVLFSSRAPIGYIAIAANDLCTNQGFKSIIPNEDTDSTFLYYLLKYNKDYIAGLGSGTTFMEVSGKVMKEVEVSIPASLKDQRRIAAILSSLDAQIENNNRINRNLEAQAQALFKSWFVDFEPWGGVMPEGWREYELGEFMPIKTGKKDANVAGKIGTYPFFSCSQDILWTDNYSFDGSAILVAGNGDFNVKWYDGKFEAYQRTYVLMPFNPRYTHFLFYAIKHFLADITCGARGSVIKFITKGNLENFKIAAPIQLESCEMLDKFVSIDAQIRNNTEANLRLASLRDTLLPKLMKGEIGV